MVDALGEVGTKSNFVVIAAETFRHTRLNTVCRSVPQAVVDDVAVQHDEGTAICTVQAVVGSRWHLGQSNRFDMAGKVIDKLNTAARHTCMERSGNLMTER